LLFYQNRKDRLAGRTDVSGFGFVGGDIARWITGVSDGVEVERHNAVGWLIFNRPAAGNAMDAAMMRLLPQLWRALDSDPAVRCIVVTGRGRAFQTGLDVAALGRDPQSLRESSRRTRDADLQLTGWHLGVRTPVVTAVNGVCAGGGLHFVVDSDLVIASTRASFVDPHVSLGQVSAWESIGLSRRISAAVAARIALLGAHERLDAERARAIGLISEVVQPGDLLDTAQRLGEIIAEQDPRLMAARKQALWAHLEFGHSHI
jgi:enoyl-CoA hydratase